MAQRLLDVAPALGIFVRGFVCETVVIRLWFARG
jgi:hypothetical protein